MQGVRPLTPFPFFSAIQRPAVGLYVRYEGDKVTSTNTIEGYFSVFKRGTKGAYGPICMICSESC